MRKSPEIPKNPFPRLIGDSSTKLERCLERGAQLVSRTHMSISDSSSSELMFSSSSESVSSMILSTEALGFEAIVVAKTRRVAVIRN